MRVFRISVSWWSFTGDWVTASLLKSSGLFSVFWPFSTMLFVVWMVSTRPLTSKSSRPFNNTLVTVPKVPITIGIIVILMFHSFFNFLARSRYLSLFSHSFSFIQQSRQFCRFSFLLLIIIRSGLLAEIRWSVCMSKSHIFIIIIEIFTLAFADGLSLESR